MDKNIKNPAHLRKQARLFFENGDFQRSISCALEAVNLESQNPVNYKIMANILCRLKKFPEAIDYCRQAIGLSPENHELINNLGAIYFESGDFQEAIRQFMIVLEKNPGDHTALNNTGLVFNKLEDFSQAVLYFKNAVSLSPASPEYCLNLGYALFNRHQYPEAEQYYRRAISLKPDFAEARLNLAILLLLQGKLTEGFREFEWRLLVNNRPPAEFFEKYWRGEPLKGKKLLIWSEHGFGDTIQFSRYLPFFSGKGGFIIFSCPPELKRLMEGMKGVDLLVTHGHTENFDYHLPVMSLANIFRTTPENIPADIPYLQASTEKILTVNKGLKIGITWESGFPNPSWKSRSCPLDFFISLEKLPGVTIFSLQKGQGEESLKQFPRSAIIPLSSQIRDFADTASFLKQLDLLITVDTAVSHLAGALGRPVWLILSYNHDWRWFTEGETSPWYPSMKIFRQKQLGDWEGIWQDVIKQIQKDFAVDLNFDS